MPMTETEKTEARKRLKAFLLRRYVEKLDRLLPFVEEGMYSFDQISWKCKEKTGEWISI